jgi:hypothetical protein
VQVPGAGVVRRYQQPAITPTLRRSHLSAGVRTEALPFGFEEAEAAE